MQLDFLVMKEIIIVVEAVLVVVDSIYADITKHNFNLYWSLLEKKSKSIDANFISQRNNIEKDDDIYVTHAHVDVVDLFEHLVRNRFFDW